jgi:CRISPR-associated endonuclease/helicase Cas3
MSIDPERYFDKYFSSLSGHKAFYPWQKKLFLQIASGNWPQIVHLPTGAGKTSVLHIWLLALAWSLDEKVHGVPRRLAWVVNRRVVVDQVTEEAESLIKATGGLDRCPEIRNTLTQASLSGEALAVSTLRGQRADKGDWRRDPSTPAVVIGTVDMIGSRLLFRGYRAGRYHRPIDAGLLGVDTLLVNDEAHLSPAFARLLEQVDAMKPAAQLSGKCFRVLLLSATPGASELRPFMHSPEEDAQRSEAFRLVYKAPKKVVLHQIENVAFESTMWQLATEAAAGRTIVFIEQPEKALAFMERLAKHGHSTALLTGTMRGFERDQLAKSDAVLARFLDRKPTIEPIWLVSTSAGEVGINISSERVITGLVEADHLLQRFGRMNRFGEGEGEAHVVCTPSKKERLARTVQYLLSLEGDISCRNVWTNKPPEEACSEVPAMARLEPRLLDTWSQTTYWDRLVPRVEPWLHGRQESETPEAEVAWRADLQYLVDWGIGMDQIERMLAQYPVRSVERLREPADRILEKLEKLSAQLGEEPIPQLLQVDSDGSVQALALDAVLKRGQITGKLLILPAGFGHTYKGMFHVGNAGEDSPADVADIESNRRRYLIDGNLWQCIGSDEAPIAAEADRSALASFAQERNLKAAFVIRHPEEPGKLLAYFAERSGFRRALSDVSLAAHQLSVEKKASEIAARVGLVALTGVFANAGAIHDEGKHHPVWQRAMGGSMDSPIAKSKAPVNLKLLNGYRHELGSLVRTASDNDDLLLHLIASHHAGGRPFFETRQFDRNELKASEVVALESARRYARLQNLYGFWGLAFLEAVFKCADGIISAEEGDAASA